MQFKVQILIEDKWETFNWQELNETILFGNDLSSYQKRFWTGLHDKNGKEIYDGDRVKRRVHLVEGRDYMDYNCAVKWNGWCYGLFIHDKQVWGLDPITARDIEVVGNIESKIGTA